MSLVLYGSEMWNSPYVLSCFVALREKNLPFETRIVALQRGAQHEPAFVGASLTARVPVLVDGALSISESSAIVEYLEDRFPSPGHARVLPADISQRARARQVMAWVRSDVGALRDERSSEYVFFPPNALASPRPLSAVGRRAAEKVVRIATTLIPASGGPLFGAWCLADTDLAMMLWRLSRTGYPLPDKVRDFADAQWERPPVREFAAMPRPAVFVAY
ncbi:MAG TPA: glutathione transferase [Polyangia bacterium]|jgi:glutathione S-transferase|nr:glutathione transferase [Polyangia bacterium]